MIATFLVFTHLILRKLGLENNPDFQPDGACQTNDGNTRPSAGGAQAVRSTASRQSGGAEDSTGAASGRVSPAVCSGFGTNNANLGLCNEGRVQSLLDEPSSAANLMSALSEQRDVGFLTDDSEALTAFDYGAVMASCASVPLTTFDFECIMRSPPKPVESEKFGGVISDENATLYENGGDLASSRDVLLSFSGYNNDYGSIVKVSKDSIPVVTCKPSIAMLPVTSPATMTRSTGTATTNLVERAGSSELLCFVLGDGSKKQVLSKSSETTGDFPASGDAFLAPAPLVTEQVLSAISQHHIGSEQCVPDVKKVELQGSVMATGLDDVIAVILGLDEAKAGDSEPRLLPPQNQMSENKTLDGSINGGDACCAPSVAASATFIPTVDSRGDQRDLPISASHAATDRSLTAKSVTVAKLLPHLIYQSGGIDFRPVSPKERVCPNYTDQELYLIEEEPTTVS